ncbi:MAG: hypothetical protein R2737_18040 [Candidatus Nanopelagicales bacterium]
MRIRRTLAIATTTALVAGAGLVAAAPAQAATRTTYSGNTAITIPGAITNAALGAGLGVYTVAPGTASLGAGNALTVNFPVSGATGGINHKGTLVFTNGAAGKIVTFANPTIDPSNKTITGVVGGVGAPFDGQRLPILVYSGGKTVTKTVTVNRTTKRTTTTITGVKVALNSAVDVSGVLNNALSTTIFQNGMTIGSAKVVSIKTVVRR